MKNLRWSKPESENAKGRNNMKELKNYNEKEDILDEGEKKFLTEVVKLYAKMGTKIITFAKYKDFKNQYEIELTFKYFNKRKITFASKLPTFKNEKMYKGMELSKEYTLEKLGIKAPKHRMTIDEFFASQKNLAIHPGCEKNAKTLCNAFDKKGYTYCTGKKYTNTCYEDKSCCYSNKHCYGSFTCYKKCSYKIIEFKDINLN